MLNVNDQIDSIVDLIDVQLLSKLLSSLFALLLCSLICLQITTSPSFHLLLLVLPVLLHRV